MDRVSSGGGFVSVVLPCYNAAATIAECLASLEDQSISRDRYEIIVGDNGSLDASVDIIRTRFPQVRIIHAVQKGSGYARNAGIEAALGDIVLSIDSDCVADRNWIAAMVAAWENAADEVGALGGMIAPYSRVTMVEHYERYWIRQENLRFGKGPVRYAETPNAAFRASALRAVGGFDGTLGFDDTDLGIRLQRAGYGIEFVPDAVVKHRNPATWSELFQHRRKYGRFDFTLALKYPDLLRDVTGPKAVRPVLVSAIRCVASGLAVRLPFTLLTGRGGPPRVWPAIEAVVAIAGYIGFRDAHAAYRRQHAARTSAHTQTQQAVPS